MDCMYYRHYKIPDNVILCPIIFTSKSLSIVEWHYSNIECKAFGTVHRLQNITTTVLLGMYVSSLAVSHYWEHLVKMSHVYVVLVVALALCYEYTSRGCTSYISLAHTCVL